MKHIQYKCSKAFQSAIYNKAYYAKCMCTRVSFEGFLSSMSAPHTGENLVVEHLENKNDYVRSVCIDFSSAFNTLKPDIVIKLRTLNVSPIMCKFILDFLTNREQRVRINDILSTVLSISTGAPQGCVLSAILYIIYTNELRSRFRNCHLIKYADDTVIVGLISNNDESENNEHISEVVQWCKAHNLLLRKLKS